MQDKRQTLPRTVIAALALLAGTALPCASFAAPAAQAAAPVATTAPAAAMSIRLGAHADYTRLVFDFPQLTAYRVEDNGAQKKFIFDTALAPDVMPKPAGLLQSIGTQRLDDRTLAVTLTLSPGATLKHYRLMRRVVADIAAPAAKAAPPKAPEKAAAKETPKAAAPVTAKAAPVTAPVTAPAKPQPAAAAAPAAKAAPAPAGMPTPAQLKLPDDPSLRVEAAPVTPVTATEQPVLPTTITLSTVEPTKVAIFQRYGQLWIVMDGKAASATPPMITGPDEGFLGAPQVLEYDGGRAYRYNMPRGRDITVARKALMWVITLGQGLSEPPPKATLDVSYDSTSKKARLLANITDTGPVAEIEDPIVGDTLEVVTASAPEARISDPRRYANVEILPAEVGMVVRPIADDVRVTKFGDYVAVTAPGGIIATPGASTAPAMIDTSATFRAGETKRLFDFPNWLQGGQRKLNENARAIEKQAADARSPEARQEALLKLALLYFANDFGQETLGVLRLITDEDPEMEKNPNILALRGAAAAMAGHYDEALADLNTPVIQQHPEVNLWIGYAAAASEQWLRADRAFPHDNALLSEYPPNIAIPMTIYMAESALRVGHADTAETLLKTLDKMDTKAMPQYKAAIDYLRGEAARQEGRFPEAIELWTPVAEGLDRLYHTKASLALTLLQLQEKQISLKDAVARIDSLRFAWRGDGLEVQILTALGRTKIMNAQYLEGLNDLKAAAGYADQLHDDSTPIRQEMAETVANLFSGKNRDKLNPLEAVSIYNDYKDLLPPGAESTAAALNFADYLTRMDLLDRAATIMDKALDDTDDAEKRADIGTRLAAIQLLDGKPALALDALLRSAPAADAKIDADLAERRTLLRARAQSQLGQTDDAITTLATLKNADARRLTADVLWRARRWREAAAAMETLLPDRMPAKLDEETARLIMNAAVGYKLAGDSDGLANLRERYAGAMTGTTFGPTFTVVTRDGGNASLSDRDTILRIANEVDLFKPLLDSYKASTKDEVEAPEEEDKDAVAPQAPAPAQQP